MPRLTLRGLASKIAIDALMVLALTDPPPPVRRGRKRRPLRRRLLLWTMLLLCVYAALETASFGIFWALRKKAFSFADLHAERLAIIDEILLQMPQASTGAAADPAKPQFVTQVTPHPFVGFTANPEQGGMDGFTNMSERSAHWRRAPDRYLIALLGGSVAAQLVTKTQQYLLDRLGEIPALADKRVEVYMLGLGGFKQPQQLMALEYALAFGCEFDCVINLDGYNEAVLGRTENLALGTHPIYPRSWRLLLDGAADVPKQIAIGKAAVGRSARLQWARWFDDSPAAWSVTLNLAWGLRDRMLRADVHAALQGLFDLERARTSLPYMQSGPPLDGITDDNVARFLADIWWRCSVQMHRACAANGMTYLHFLQPNQYVPGSKPMSAAEREVAVAPTDDPLPRAAAEGYAALAAASARLLDARVDFTDLRMLFADVAEPLYVDPCCHYNVRGNEILAARIAATLRQRLEPMRSIAQLRAHTAEITLEHQGARLAVDAIYRDGTASPAASAGGGATWTSSNPAVVSVDSGGTARARRFGTAEVTVRIGKASCTMLVHSGPVLAYGDRPESPRLVAAHRPELGNRRFCLEVLEPEVGRMDSTSAVALFALQLGFYSGNHVALLHETTLLAPLDGRGAVDRPLAVLALPLPPAPALLGAYAGCHGTIVPLGRGSATATNSLAMLLQ